jgi:hypothetical protein
MNTTFTNEEYTDIHFMYGFCNGKSRALVEEYWQWFLNQITPNKHVFIRVHQRLRETGSFHTSTRECPAQQAIGVQESVLHTAEQSPRTGI